MPTGRHRRCGGEVWEETEMEVDVFDLLDKKKERERERESLYKGERSWVKVSTRIEGIWHETYGDLWRSKNDHHDAMDDAELGKGRGR
jgi:hypothetical protein